MIDTNKAAALTLIGQTIGYSRKKFSACDLFLKPLEKFFSRPLNEWSAELARASGVGENDLLEKYSGIHSAFKKLKLDYNVVSYFDGDYPKLLFSTKDAPLCLFYQGDLTLLRRPVISIVGTRNPSDEGLQRAAKLALLLCGKGFVVASGLARGIDTAAHTSALNCGGKTVAVIGTPLDKFYPPENKKMQQTIADRGLVISQFPFTVGVSPSNFPIRNYTMSGISAATVVVEAGETSGALIQARQCLEQGQGRRLFILKNVLKSNLKWPKKFHDLGATVIDDTNLEEIIDPLYSLTNFASPPAQSRLKTASIRVA